MKYFTFLLLIFAAYEPELFSQTVFTLEKNDAPGCVEINGTPGAVEAIPLPVLQAPLREVHPIFLQNSRAMLKGGLVNETVNAGSMKCVLQPGDHFAFELDTRSETIKFVDPLGVLSDKVMQAIAAAPSWMEDQLTMKMQLLQKSSNAEGFAKLILDAPQKMKDEVAAFIAYTSVQTLTDSRFLSDKEMIIRNAEMIYKLDDSLQFVDLVEGNPGGKDYYTTTKYRIYDPIAKDTIWSEIPKEIYYLYVVCAKMDQEGVYVKENSGSEMQRTYDLEWRKFIWDNPDPTHDYTQVNITTSKGTISTIPRFGDLLKKPKILWDRARVQYPFKRPYTDNDNALDVIGHWASQALPVDVTPPRSFQPNQILMKHNGNCNEDAFLVTAACRTALIPTIYLGTWSEDHVFSAVWDQDWNHFEIFRGGLQSNGNAAFGITNLTKRGSYNWKNGYVDGFRPDGFPLDFTRYYADTCTLVLTVTDTAGTPIEGAMLTLYATNTYSQGYMQAGRFWTDANGVATIGLGAGKMFGVRLSHPLYGSAPADQQKIYVLTQSATGVNQTYKGIIPFPNALVKKLSPTNSKTPETAAFGVHAKWSVRNILTSANLHDSQQSKFYYWNDSLKGEISYFICDSSNYEKFKKNQEFNSYAFYGLTNGGDATFGLPAEGKWFVVFSNHDFASYCQFLNMDVELVKDPIVSVTESQNDRSQILIAPNPAYHSISVTGYAGYVEILDALGAVVWKGDLRSGESVDISSFSVGVYYAKTGSAVEKFVVIK